MKRIWRVCLSTSLTKQCRHYSPTLLRLQNPSQIQRIDLLPKIRSARKPMSGEDLAEIFTSLTESSLSDSHGCALQDLIRELSAHLTSFPQIFNSPHELGIAFRCLNRLTDESPENRNLHFCLTRMIPAQTQLQLTTSLLPISTILDVYSSLTNFPSHLDSSHQLLVTMFPYLQSQIGFMNSVHCSNLLYYFQSSSQSSDIVQETIKLITDRIHVLFPTSTKSVNSKSMSIKFISKCMFGVRNFSNSMNEITSLLQLLSNHFSQLPRDTPINIQEIHHIICCLHGPQMNLYRLEMKILIQSFCERIEYNYEDITQSPPSVPLSLSSVTQSSKSQLSIHSVGSYITDILSSFGQQTSDNPLTQQLLLSINSFLMTKSFDGKKTKFIPRYYLSPHQIGLSMLGMKNMSCSHNGVSEIVESLSHYLKKSMNNPDNYSEIYPIHSHLTGKDISSCLQGLGSMSDENRAVKHFLLSIYEKLKYFRDINFTVSDVCVSLNGFRGMTSKYQKIGQVIEILIEKFIRLAQGSHSFKLSGSLLSLALSGLQRMVPSEQLPNLKAFIDMLLFYGKYSIPWMSFPTLQITFTSLVYMGLSYLPLPSQFMESLLEHLIRSLPSTDQKELTLDVSKLMLFQSIHLLNSSSLNVSPSMKQMMDEILTLISPCIPLVQQNENKYENKIYNRLSVMFKSNPNISLSKYQMVNGFATDILMFIKQPSQSMTSPQSTIESRSWKDCGSDLVYNIEIDGPLHDIAKKQFYYSHRDEYFKSLGIVVIRLPLKECGYHSGARLDHFLRKILKENMKEELLYNK